MSWSGLYGIADSSFPDPRSQALLLLEEGACAVQLRCKEWPEQELEAMAMSLIEEFRKSKVPLILNDVFLPHCSDGCHLGQADGTFLREKAPAAFIWGRSTHNILQLSAAKKEGATYAGFGPIFDTSTKQNLAPRVGLCALREAMALGLPLVAIGGITPQNVGDVGHTGASMWTAIGAIWNTPTPRQSLRDLSESFDLQRARHPQAESQIPDRLDDESDD